MIGTLTADQEKRLEAAARALQGHPFGFTREDVDQVRNAAEQRRRDDDNRYDAERAAALDSLATRIETLLRRGSA